MIGLARVDGLAWLPALFGTVWLPTEVLAEVLPGRGFAEETALDAALRAGWLSACDASPLEPELPDVDEGEAACIRWALRWAGEGVGSLLRGARRVIEHHRFMFMPQSAQRIAHTL